jgi:hypothetical protein
MNTPLHNGLEPLNLAWMSPFGPHSLLKRTSAKESDRIGNGVWRYFHDFLQLHRTYTCPTCTDAAELQTLEKSGRSNANNTTVAFVVPDTLSQVSTRPNSRVSTKRTCDPLKPTSEVGLGEAVSLVPASR